MDLTATACSLKQAQVSSQVQVRVAQKVLANQKQQGAAALQLLDAARPGRSGPGDALVARATGLGGALDTYG